MKTVLLTDICDIQYGYPFDSSKFNDSQGMPLIRIRDVMRGFSETYTTEECDESYIITEGELLVGMDGEFNISRWGKEPALLNQRVCHLIPKKVDKGYLFYFMPSALKKIEMKTPFVTVKHLSAKELNKVVVPLPEMEEQCRISATLDKVSLLISKRREELAKLDGLVKARFVEMFGDPKDNAMNWSVYSLGDLFKVSSSKRIYQNEQVPEGIPFLRISDLMNRIERADETAELFISEELYEKLKDDGLVPLAGDILVTSRGTLGQCYEIREHDKFYFQDGMISWLYDRSSKISNNYLMHLFQMPGFRVQIDETPAGSTVNYLSISRIKKLKIMCPSIECQQQFADFVSQVDRSKAAVERSLASLETLKKSLMQQYFG